MIAGSCEELFGFCPKIVFSENDTAQNLKLKYKVNKFTTEMGYKINNNLSPLIDEVLRFCNDEFC